VALSEVPSRHRWPVSSSTLFAASSSYLLAGLTLVVPVAQPPALGPPPELLEQAPSEWAAPPVLWARVAPVPSGRVVLQEPSEPVVPPEPSERAVPVPSGRVAPVPLAVHLQQPSLAFSSTLPVPSCSCLPGATTSPLRHPKRTQNQARISTIRPRKLFGTRGRQTQLLARSWRGVGGALSYDMRYGSSTRA
jgi:hypothetical protein